MKWQYNTIIKFPTGEKRLKYSVEDRKAIYKFQGQLREISVNPLTVFDDILIDIADNFLLRW